MNKLSLELLSETFAKIEGNHMGRVFAVLGNARSLKVLTGVLEAHKAGGVQPGDGLTLWGSLLIVNDDMPGGVLHLCVYRGPHQWPTVDDLHEAAPLFDPDEDPGDLQRWSVRLDLR